ncbi:MAG: hypothetical protein JXA99_03325 [Candidatus Lokiarchaeota archaeon]|nr:hypothetical protein [Candidatus Lokiarchaeota archaeon]
MEGNKNSILVNSEEIKRDNQDRICKTIYNYLISNKVELNKDLKILINNRNKHYYHEILKIYIPYGFFNLTTSNKGTYIFLLNQLPKEERIPISILNIFNGKSLFEFALKFKKFDIILDFDLFNSNINTTSIKNSFRFIYRHLLKKRGFFCITNKNNGAVPKKFFMKEIEPKVQINIKKKIDLLFYRKS